MLCEAIGAVATRLMTAVCDTVCRGVVRGAETMGETVTARVALGATVLVMAANTGWLATRTATSAAPVTAPPFRPASVDDRMWIVLCTPVHSTRSDRSGER